MDPSTTILEALIANVRQTAHSYHPGAEEAPVAILWTDPDGDWKPILQTLRDLMPELLSFGEYAPKKRQGPAIWLKPALAGLIDGVSLPENLTPVIYLPGISRHELRNADQCPWEIQPLVELLYRGVVWSHKNGRDWSLEAFFVADEGLALDLALDEHTKLSLRMALGEIVKLPISRLLGTHLESADFDTIVVGDTTGDVLTWIGHGDAVKTEWPSERWHAFRSRCQDEYDFDPEKEGPLYAAEQLGSREGPWLSTWSRFCEAPAHYSGVEERLDQAQPTDMLALNPEPWPRENKALENQLHDALISLANLSEHDVRQRIGELEKDHGVRRSWVWASLDQAPLAVTLEPLYALAEATRSVPSFSALEEFTSWYVDTGYSADAAAMKALEHAVNFNCIGPIQIAIRSMYQPWLEEVCQKFQKLAPDGPPIAADISINEGECLLFVDGLRLDLGHHLAKRLEAINLTVEFDTRYSAVPSVTATAKPAVSPVASVIKGLAMPPDFIPNTPDNKGLTTDRFRKLLDKHNILRLDPMQPDMIGGDAGAWCETGQVDHRGHDLGADLAAQIPTELDRVVLVIERILRAGWKSIKIVTDHGWLLMPGGLEKADLPKYLVESRWSRCACIKGESSPNTPTVPWRWNPTEHVAVAPGAKSYKGGIEYSHGGVSPQECILPVITIIDSGSSTTSMPSIATVTWKRQRCSISIYNPSEGLKADIRLHANDSKSSVSADVKDVEADGLVSILIADETLEDKTVFVVLLNSNNELISKIQTKVGE